MNKIFVYFILSWLFLSTAAYAGLEDDLSGFFKRKGIVYNQTKSGAYKDQSGGYYAGGGLMARIPPENATIFSLQPPSFKGGCGGIDAHFGGYSFINSDALVKLFNTIGSQAQSYAFSIALQTVAPQIKSALDQLMALAQDANNMNINSCSASAALVGSVIPKTDASSKMLCQNIGISNNKFSDYAAARQGCTAQEERLSINSKKNGEFVDQLGEEFNITWKALNKNNMFTQDAELAELFMSISGSIISRKVSKNSTEGLQVVTLPSLAKSEEWLKHFIDGRGDGQSFLIYECEDKNEDKCLHPKSKELSHAKGKSFLEKVDTLTRGIAKKLKENGELTEEEKKFVNSTNIPVLKIISVQTAFKRGEIENSPIGIAEFSEIIAYDLILNYIDRVIDIVENSITKLKSVQINDNYINDFFADLNLVRTLLYQRRQGIFHYLNETLSAIERTQQIEKQLYNLFMQESE